ncbi:MAG: alpha/beta fold hydrolase [Mycobacterium sp.]
MIASRFTPSGDARLHYLDSGDDDRKPPIVFVPGMTDIADDYEEVAPLFGRRLVVVELRGHGQSSAPSDGYDLAALSGDVDAVVDAVADGPVHLVTFSRGTSYAVKWAIDHPGRVLSIAIGDYLPEERIVERAAAQSLLDGRWRGSPVRERVDTRAALQTFAAAQERSFWEPLSQLQLPLLAVRSLSSGLVSEADWQRYARLFPTAELVEFDDSPHDIFRPDRGRYPRLVRRHVDRAEAAIRASSPAADR